jgi:DNA polymerase-4
MGKPSHLTCSLDTKQGWSVIWYKKGAMSASRRIIHLDLDAFFCAVEEQLNPTLRGVPFAVGGRPEDRGVVSSCSYPARAFGVHSAMPMRQAVKACADLVIVSSHFHDYREASRKVMKRLTSLTDLVEQISIDEAFLDVTEVPGPIEDLARQLQNGINQDFGLPNSLGVATNKLVAKIATDVGKRGSTKGTPPNAITIVPPGTEADFLAALPVEMLWGVGPKTAAKLAEIGVKLIGELAQIPDIELIRRYGKNGYDLGQRAKGIDNSPITTEHETKSISQEVTYARDVRDETRLHQTLNRQSEFIAQQLQKQGLTARTVKLKLRWPNFTTLTRQTTLRQPTTDGNTIAQAALELFKSVWAGGRAVRLLGVGVSGLDSPPKQIGLWDVDWEKEYKIQDLLAEVHDRFGEDALRRGV